MLIRSQCKKYLANFDLSENIHHENCKGDFEVVNITSTGRDIIGIYSTEAKVIKVLDMIQDAYTSADKISQNYIDGIGVLENGYIGNVIFKMPLDEEVEDENAIKHQ